MLLLTLADFWQQNYLWIIIVVAILILALIGYVAEKHDIVAFRKKESKKENIPPVNTMPVMETIQPKVYEQVVNVGGKTVPVDEIEEIDFDGDLVKPVMESIDVPKPKPDVIPNVEDIDVPLPTTEEEEGIAIENNKTAEVPNTEADVNTDEVSPEIPKELYQPFGDTSSNQQANPSESEVWKF